MTTALTTTEPQPLAVNPSGQPSPITVLEAAVRGGINSENVAVVKEILAMCREQRADDAKAAFGRAFFAMKKEMPAIYADKEVRTKSGALAFEYCSPREIQDAIDPVMKRHGFCTMTGQEKDEKGYITASVTLYHDGGHSETRSFTVRAGSGNALMSEAQCDAAATTSAERHALIKMLGLRTRVRGDDEDARNVGSAITAEQAADLRALVEETNSDKAAFLKFAGAETFETIADSRYDDVLKMLQRKLRGAQ